MNIEQIAVGVLQVNCYIVWESADRRALIIDPGDEPERISQRVTGLEVKPAGILLTHGHVDHIRAVPALCRDYGVEVSLHPAAHALYLSPQNEIPPWVSAAENLPPAGNVPDDLPGLAYRVLPTPGHTPGGCCYYFPDAGAVFSGDTLFCRGIGRTDFAGGNSRQLLESINRELMQLPSATNVYPGHGPATTIGAEKTDNPFLDGVEGR